MGYLFNRIEKELDKEGLKPGTNAARSWLLKKIKDLTPTRAQLLKDRESLRDKTIVGRFFFFYYDPKLKLKLPYYDRFPLTIPIELYHDGFLGLNFHYVHPNVRLKLLTMMLKYATNTKMDESTRLRLTYPTLKSAANLYMATPCIKRYLWTQVRSRFLQLDANEWDIAMLLPLQQFKKAQPEEVYEESHDSTTGHPAVAKTAKVVGTI